MQRAEDLRRAISQLAVRVGNKAIGLTCSIGVPEWEPGDGVDTLLRRADISLYEAKHSVAIELSKLTALQFFRSTRNGEVRPGFCNVRPNKT